MQPTSDDYQALQHRLAEVERDRHGYLELASNRFDEIHALQREVQSLKADNEWQKERHEQHVAATEAEVTRLRGALEDIKADLECTTNECITCGHTEPLTNFDVYLFVKQALAGRRGEE